MGLLFESGGCIGADLGPVRHVCTAQSRCRAYCAMRGNAGAGERIALEADGLSQFTTNTLAPCHRLITRHRLLAARGWLLISVPCYLWQRLNDAGRGAWLLQARPPLPCQAAAPRMPAWPQAHAGGLGFARLLF